MNRLVGLKIVKIREMTKAEMNREGWRTSRFGPSAVAIELSDGTIIYPSQDSEGNGPGILFMADKKGTYTLCATSEPALCGVGR